jgi:light-regulated signal transduction histidine kinase (bacteriophytochrome)
MKSSEEIENIIKLNEELQQKLVKQSEQIDSLNKELEAFSHSISHDLRAPLRSINGYSEILKEEFGKKLDEEGNRIIGIICYNAEKMGTLIDELLTFS